jgi:hypothetical protein
MTLPLACKAVDLPVRRLLRVIVRPPLTGAIPAVALCVAFRLVLPPASLAAVLAEGALVGLTYFAVLITFGLDRDVRARYTGLLQQLWPGKLAPR